MKKKLAFILSVAFAMTATINTAFAYDFTTATNGIQTSNNRGAGVEYTKAYANIVKSFINQDTDGTITRVELINGNVFVEEYTKDYEYISTKQLPLELPKFGGVYFGNDYNFIVFGQSNKLAESPDREVLRIVKYDKEWNVIKSTSVLGANTVNPFSSSNLTMVEKNGTLYIRTSHQMFKSPNDGKNHQASMMFSLNIDSMEVTGKQVVVANNGIGYVSHSFSQNITTNGSELFVADLGDAFPRSVIIMRGQNFTGEGIKYIEAFPIPGNTGQNTTGINLGGIAYTSGTSTSAITAETINVNNVLVAGRMEANYETDWQKATEVRNIFVLVANATDNGAFGGSYMVPITNYVRPADATNAIKTTTPKLVKVSDDKLFVIWNEYVGSIAGTSTVKFVEIDNNGLPVSDIQTIDAMLSDNQPFVSGDEILWYATTGDVPTFYTLNSTTQTLTSASAIGTTFNYEPIIVEYEPETPMEETDDTDETDNSQTDDTNTDSSDNSQSTGGGSSSSSNGSDKNTTGADKNTSDKEITVTIKEDAKEIKYFEIDKNQKNFYPNKSASRFDIIKYLSNLFDIKAPTSNKDFADTTSLTQKEKDIINLFTNGEIVKGYEDGTFKPDAPITRAEFVTILSRILNFEPSTTDGKFTDTTDHWANDYINYFYQFGYINGYPDGTFRPDENISNAEVVVILNRITGAYSTANNSPVASEVAFDDLPENHWARKQILHSVSQN